MPHPFRTWFALVVATGAAMSLSGCTVPRVGYLAVGRADDGTLLIHVRLCEGSGRFDGLTLHMGDTTVARIEPDDGIGDRTTWTVGPLDTAPEDLPDALRVYAWTRDNTESASGPSVAPSRWSELTPGDLFIMSADGAQLLHQRPIDDWYDRRCDS